MHLGSKRLVARWKFCPGLLGPFRMDHLDKQILNLAPMVQLLRRGGSLAKEQHLDDCKGEGFANVNLHSGGLVEDDVLIVHSLRSPIKEEARQGLWRGLLAEAVDFCHDGLDKRRDVEQFSASNGGAQPFRVHESSESVLGVLIQRRPSHVISIEAKHVPKVRGEPVLIVRRVTVVVCQTPRDPIACQHLDGHAFVVPDEPYDETAKVGLHTLNLESDALHDASLHCLAIHECFRDVPQVCRRPWPPFVAVMHNEAEQPQ
mmetsp:Transcript_42963/g.118816  ORF Transcript_42963/g.118816 Transcript_42963/m.118816 type:complete len:260 (+) Transcript_42963:192-971(+)